MAQEGSSMEMGTSDQVLVAAKKSKKLVYGIGFIAMVAAIAVVVTLIVVFAADVGGSDTNSTPQDPTPVTTPSPTPSPGPDATDSTTPSFTTPTPPSPTPPQDIDLDAILNGQFSAVNFNGTWTSGSEILFRNSYGNLVKYNVDEDDTLLVVSNTSQYLLNSYQFNEMSADQRYIALSFNELTEYRYSFYAQYVVKDTRSDAEFLITPPGVTEANALLQNFRWAPSGPGFAFVYENNVYYQSNLTNEPVQISTNGKQGIIYNGVPDWVYEEEVFASNNAIWFSKDSNRLAYATFDDTNVRIMKIPNFGIPGSVDHQYTRHHEIRYPKSGTINPTVSVTLRLLEDGTQSVYTAPSDLTEPILKTVTFVNANTIGVMWTNRVQTQFVVELCTQGTAVCQRIYSYTEVNGWIDNIPLIFNEQGTAFITILPYAVNNVLYKQVVQVSQGATPTALWTLSGRSNTAHTVVKILKWTPGDVIWYLATKERDATEQHIYSITSNSLNCFTCDLRRPDGELCLYNDGVINDDTTRLTLNCNGPNVPQVFIYNTNGTLIRVWEENRDVADLSSSVELPVTFREDVYLGAGIPDGKVLIQAPRDYLSRTNLPLLVNVYAGPDTAQVTKQWNVDWGTYLVSRFGIAVAKIDGRGSGLQGVQNMFAVNRKLGTVEVEDQITVTKYLQDRLSFIDRNRTCIWGWSYGGYASSMALARGGDVFRCAIAVAPVVDWHYYDTIYTERYMDTPQANPEAYANSSLLTDAVVESYRDKRYFLVHGTEDDNVHYQHAMLFSRRLQLKDVYFTQMSYTDEDHGLGGVKQHLYHALEKFLKENML
ncbi:unnamed protein product [Pieris brassicae]|uniref:Venom dipeptidyl peptidase 4 n=1 Tax=Pieris brassicae TaxID=7116 RepID=A0A9P0TQ80_PIEBR|nr:unnamed protein product [Pieris brassicae]